MKTYRHNMKIHYINDSIHKGYYFFWLNMMKIYPTKREAQEALNKLMKGQ